MENGYDESSLTQRDSAIRGSLIRGSLGPRENLKLSVFRPIWHGRRDETGTRSTAHPPCSP